jgi:outer membrane PBP1 activator LpoA protein
MTDLKKAAQQALEALEKYATHGPLPGRCPVREAEYALKAALVQQEQAPVADAMKTVTKAMQDDPDYAWSWHCNVAMAFVDAGGDSYTANQGAARFMRLLANVDPAHELPSHPPRRKWQSLSEDELTALGVIHSRYQEESLETGGWFDFARAIEAALKEKNK